MSCSLETWWWLHLAVTGAMTGVIWTVQRILYPFFSEINPAQFVAYHRRYTRRITSIVAPLMMVEGATAVALWWSGLRSVGFLSAVGLLAVIWLSTFAWQVPLHRRLENNGYDADTHRRLVASNWIRTVAWTLRLGLLLAVTR